MKENRDGGVLWIDNDIQRDKVLERLTTVVSESEVRNFLIERMESDLPDNLRDLLRSPESE